MSSLTTSIVVFVASIVAALLGYALQRPLRLAAPGDEMRSAARGVITRTSASSASSAARLLAR